jgi:hypothetical protein
MFKAEFVWVWSYTQTFSHLYILFHSLCILVVFAKPLLEFKAKILINRCQKVAPCCAISEIQQRLHVYVTNIINKERSTLVRNVFLSPHGSSGSVGAGSICLCFLSYVKRKVLKP